MSNTPPNGRPLAELNERLSAAHKETEDARPTRRREEMTARHAAASNMMKLSMTSTVPLIDLKRAARGVAVTLLALTLPVLPGAATTTSRAARQAGGAKAVAFKGVGFYYDRALASDVKAEIAPGGGCGKPGDVVPVRAAFTLEGYPKPHAAPFMTPPEIQVFPVAEYRRALAACDKEMAALSNPSVSYYARDFDEQVGTLKRLVAARPAPPRLAAFLTRGRGQSAWKGRIPFLPMYDVSEAVRAKVSYLDFRNGKGVAFVAQYTIEDTLISNQALAYVFQGLTDDGEYYVSAAFPLAAPFLPPDYGDEEAARHGLRFLGGDPSPAFRRKYQNYLAATARRLEALAPDQYRPHLRLLDELVRSLHVNQELLKSSVGTK